MRVSKVQWILFAACFLLCSLAASAATPDENKFWTTVGSAGTLDEKSEGKVFFERAIVQKGHTLVIGQDKRQQVQADGGFDVTDTAVIRYNITAVDGVFGDGGLMMAIRLLAEGQSARVTVELIEVDLITGDEVTMMNFDSDDVPAVSGYHVEVLQDCSGRKDLFDFTKKAYYIEVTLTNSEIAESSAAGIEMIHVLGTSCHN